MRNGQCGSTPPMQEAVSFLLKWFAKHAVDVLMALGPRGGSIVHRRPEWPGEREGEQETAVAQHSPGLSPGCSSTQIHSKDMEHGQGCSGTNPAQREGQKQNYLSALPGGTVGGLPHGPVLGIPFCVGEWCLLTPTATSPGSKEDPHDATTCSVVPLLMPMCNNVLLLFWNRK